MRENRIEIVPIRQAEAKAFVNQFHRHHKASLGSVFQIGCAYNDQIIGVASVGRPVARHYDNGWTLEVNRLCVKEGYPNACSMLYSACWRVAKGIGYKKVITYILDNENGASLRASNWKEIGSAGGGSWDTKIRPRVDKHPTQKKILFEVT